MKTRARGKKSERVGKLYLIASQQQNFCKTCFTQEQGFWFAHLNVSGIMQTNIQMWETTTCKLWRQTESTFPNIWHLFYMEKNNYDSSTQWCIANCRLISNSTVDLHVKSTVKNWWSFLTELFLLLPPVFCSCLKLCAPKMLEHIVLGTHLKFIVMSYM